GHDRAKAFTWERAAHNLRDAMVRVRERVNQPIVVREVAPLVSIVTPSLNQGQFLRRTIESVLGQDYPHIEYTVVDGGSTDESVDILRSYEGRLTWSSEPDRGQAHAINTGFARCKAE